MADSLFEDQSNVIAGLGTFTHTCLHANLYTVKVNSTCSCDPGSLLNSAQTTPFDSNLLITIQHNSSNVVTEGGSASQPSPSQGNLGAMSQFYCAVGDTISVILSSTSSIDSVPNNVKSVVSVFQGR